MIWKMLLLIGASVLIFISGFFLGGIDWSWRTQAHASDVAFWSMVGGWFSAAATFFAVLVSLGMAYQASQNGAEKVSLRLSPDDDRYDRPTDSAHLEIKNLRPVTVVITKVLISIHGSEVTSDISFMGRRSYLLPYAMYQPGEKLDFYFCLSDHVKMASVFTDLKRHGEPTFKRGFIWVETAMGLHKIKLPSDFLAAFKQRYEQFYVLTDRLHASGA